MRCASESALVGWPLPAAVVARTASLAMAIALALMSWLSVAMELSLIRFGTARRRSDAWSTDAWIGYRLGRRKTRRHLDRLGVPKRTQRFLGSSIQPSVALQVGHRALSAQGQKTCEPSLER